MSEKIPVRFVKSWRSFFKDDVAGFPDDVATELVDGGVAVHLGASAAPGEDLPTSRASRSRGKGGASARKGKAEGATAPGAEPPAPSAGEGLDAGGPAVGGEGGEGGGAAADDDDNEKP